MVGKYGGMDFEALKKMKLEYIEDVTARADEIQKEILADILSKNARVEYLSRFGLDGRTDRESFKKVVPVFFLSSGTSSGESKIIPATETDNKLRSLCISLVMPVLSQFVDTKKGFYIKNLRSSDRPYDYYSDITSPPDTVLCTDVYQSMYSQMLCGLLQNRQVIRVGAPFVTGIIRAVRFLQDHWSALCRDIRTGSLDPAVDCQSVRDAVLGMLKPDPDLADLVEAECMKGSWQGIIRRLWPNANHIEATATGTMSHYIPMMDYYSGGLPVANLTYRCSESFSVLARWFFPFDIHVVDYTSYADVASTIPGHYVIYWELNQKGFGSASSSSVMEQCCLAVEDALNEEYRERRVYGHIGPLEIKIVESGTFDKLMEHAISSGRSILQYKTPRCVKGESSMMAILNAGGS
ncbi:hypothetical protein M569_08308 [Genlisea aurea]|uniref:GH3 C-terminal domain-containing protein n=1 Tax=Genlisea aurea TaxID=192259 RepID=S8DTI8_9LAMI|nr:hypothetical protein M569_08308 [Genlisea aurea]